MFLCYLFIYLFFLQLIKPVSSLVLARTFFPTHRFPVNVICKHPVSMASNLPNDDQGVQEAKITKISANIERHDYYPEGKIYTLFELGYISKVVNHFTRGIPNIDHMGWESLGLKCPLCKMDWIDEIHSVQVWLSLGLHD